MPKLHEESNDRKDDMVDREILLGGCSESKPELRIKDEGTDREILSKHCMPGSSSFCYLVATNSSRYQSG